MVMRSWPALAAADRDLATVERQVLEAEFEGLHQPEPRAVEQLRHEAGGPARLGGNGGDLVA
jgi:hypothetical protein